MRENWPTPIFSLAETSLLGSDTVWLPRMLSNGAMRPLYKCSATLRGFLFPMALLVFLSATALRQAQGVALIFCGAAHLPFHIFSTYTRVRFLD